jgi:hypothetical protein
VKRYWEIVADKLSKAGWSWRCVSAIDANGRTIWIADAHRGDGHCVDRANEIFAEMRRVTDWLQQKVNGASASLDLSSASALNRATLRTP